MRTSLFTLSLNILLLSTAPALYGCQDSFDSIIDKIDENLHKSRLLIQSTKEFINKHQPSDYTGTIDLPDHTQNNSVSSFSLQLEHTTDSKSLNFKEVNQSEEILVSDPVSSPNESINDELNIVGNIVSDVQITDFHDVPFINSEYDISEGSQDTLNVFCPANNNEMQVCTAHCSNIQQSTNDCQYSECNSYVPAHSQGSVYSLLYATSSIGDRPAFVDSIYSCGMILFDDSLKNLNTLLFLDFNVSNFSQGGNGFSLGGGFRYTIPCTQYKFGFNSYFDYSDASKYSFRQISVGLEIFKSCWLLVSNAYFPIGKSSADRSTITYDDYDGDYIVTVDSSLNILKGFDFEVGRIYSLCNCQLYPFVGGYYLSGSCCSNMGIAGGMLFSLNNVLSIEGRGYYDKCNRATGEVKLSLFLPICSSCSFKSTHSCDNILMNRTRRRNYIPYEQYCHYETNY